MERELPEGWVSVAIKDYFEQVTVKTDPADTESATYIGLEHLKKGGGIENTGKSDDLKSAKSVFKKGDVLYGKLRPYLDKHTIVDFEGICSTDILVFRAKNLDSAKLLNYFLGTSEVIQYANENSQGVNLPRVSGTIIGQLHFLLPPLAEQKRIVAKLDEAFQHLDTLKAKLERIPELLKNFRQAVLTQAITGKLTKGDNTNDWQHVELVEVAERIQIGPFGTQLHKHDYVSSAIPLINPSHIKNGRIVPDQNLTVLEEKYDELQNYHLETGDIIMGRRGEMGRCALVTEVENGWLCGTGSLFIRPKNCISGRFLYWVLSSNDVKRFLENQSQGSTMNNLNLTIVKSIKIPLPSLKEQEKIFAKVDELFAKADAIEGYYATLKEKIDKLPQALLAKAFRGKLVPQDPNDEPASVLLEKIKAAKAGAVKAGKGKKAKGGKQAELVL